MRYAYTAGPYREFRGYVFANGKPVTIIDRGTMLALAREPGFEEVKDEPAPVVMEAPKPVRQTLGLRRK